MIKKELALIISFCLGVLVSGAMAEEITIVYTGNTHAMIYPCNCPVEPDGGIARRAALIAQLREKNTDLLLLDSGNFFAGGLLDINTQNTDLDKERTVVNLKAMALMRYDAVACGSDEFNFGRAFLEENVKKENLPLISCDMDSSSIKPYIIKEIKGIKLGVIGLTGSFAQDKAGDIKFIDSEKALKLSVDELRKKGAQIIVLLSAAPDSDLLTLAQNAGGIDILIAGKSQQKEETVSKAGNILIVRPSWQGRRLGVLSLTIDAGKISAYKVDDSRLSSDIKDDPGMQKILPVCFSNANCKKAGYVGACSNAGSPQAQCIYSESKKVEVMIITPKECKVCNTQSVVDSLKKRFATLSVSYLYYPLDKADKLIRELNIKFLPAYIFTKSIEVSEGFSDIKKIAEEKGDYYILSPEASGFSYFLGRKKIEGKLDLFISLYDRNAPLQLDEMKQLRPELHFLAVKSQDWFDAAKGSVEVEEYLRCVCVRKYFPDKFWDYVTCRAKNINSSWWEDCAGNFNIEKIKTCARSQEGAALLQGNINLNKELQVMFGPTYLLDNQEIFSSNGVTKKEEINRLIKK